MGGGWSRPTWSDLWNIVSWYCKENPPRASCLAPLGFIKSIWLYLNLLCRKLPCYEGDITLSVYKGNLEVEWKWTWQATAENVCFDQNIAAIQRCAIHFNVSRLYCWRSIARLCNFRSVCQLHVWYLLWSKVLKDQKNEKKAKSPKRR